MALGGFKNSACLVWPVTVSQFPRSQVNIAKPDKIDAPNLMLIHDLDELECWSFTFYSYLVRWTAYPAIRSFLSPGHSASCRIASSCMLAASTSRSLQQWHVQRSWSSDQQPCKLCMFNLTKSCQGRSKVGMMGSHTCPQRGLRLGSTTGHTVVSGIHGLGSATWCQAARPNTSQL